MNVAALVSIIFTTICTGLTENVCKTKGCLEMASFLQKSMDTFVDPCDDFYAFVCGKYIETLHLKGAYTVDLYKQLIEEVTEKVIASYSSKPSDTDPEWLKKLKNVYLSCMDTASLEKDSIEKMKKQLDKYGVWPVLVSDWNETDFNWLELEKKFIAAGEEVNHLIGFYLYTPDDGNSTTNMIEIDTTDLNLDQLLGDTDVLQNYLKALVGIAVIFGADKDQAEQDMKEVLDFEVALAQLVDDSDETNEPAKISELQEAWPYISWLDLISFTFGDYNNITEDELVRVTAPSYFDGLGDLLSNTSKRVLANYLFSRVVYLNAEFLTEEIRNLTYAAYYKPIHPKRSDTCYSLAALMDYAVAAAYVRNYVPVKEKKEATKMTEMLREELIKVITAADWMSNSSKTRAISKVRQVKEDIAYPDQILNDTFLNNLYKDLKICPKSVAKNKRALEIWTQQYLNKKLRQQSYKQWDINEEYLLSPNPAYLQLGPMFVGYASSMEGLLFSSDRPMYLNLATLGGPFARELTKSVDEVGRYYNGLGQYGNWWDNVTEEKYLKKRHAIELEYSTYIVRRERMERLNGTVFAVPIVADQGGFKIARNAMDVSLKTSGQNLKLPGLEQYSVQKTFWMASTIFYCSKWDPDYVEYVLKHGDTPPNKVRVMGSFGMSPQFAKDWSCPKDSYMDPEQKFNVW